MIVALIPLILSSIRSRGDVDTKDKFESTYSALDDEQKKKVDDAVAKVERGDGDEGDIINAFPGHRLKGALLSQSTWMHWAYAFASAGAFLLVIMLVMPSNTTSPLALGATALFTGTIGILLLLAAQWMAFHMPLIRGGGVVGLVLLLLRGIGLAYASALDPDSGFVLSLLGFTLGVGLCEELCKALPVFSHYVSAGLKMDWRGACIWGLASGVGFGVSEGITYSSEQYNGITGGDIYLIRFLSCVALHAIWAGAAGICIWKNQDRLRALGLGHWERFFNLVWIVFPPMLMHGMYDTLLKEDHYILAMLTALISFGYFAWVVEGAKSVERVREPHVVPV